jgi:hypothetical protein
MTDAIVGVMVEVLCVLAIATKEIKQSRTSELSQCDRSTLSTQCFAEMFLNKLVGRTDMENALQRLENVTLEESRMTGAEALKAIHSVGNKVGDKVHGVQDALQAVHDKVGGVEDMLQGITEILQGVGDKVINGVQTIHSAESTALIVYMVRCG